MGMFVLSIAFGIGWNAASLWCLVRLLRCWMGPRPSWRRALAWAGVKFLALYGVAALALFSGRVSVLGFSVGFTLSLAVAVAWLATRGRGLLVPRA